MKWKVNENFENRNYVSSVFCLQNYSWYAINAYLFINQWFRIPWNYGLFYEKEEWFLFCTTRTVFYRLPWEFFLSNQMIHFIKNITQWPDAFCSPDSIKWFVKIIYNRLISIYHKQYIKQIRYIFKLTVFLYWKKNWLILPNKPNI